MSEEKMKFACPYCEHAADSRETLKTHLETAHPAPQVWGREVYPPPRKEGFIDADVMKCTGCGLCAEACSMRHYGVMNKEYARIYQRNFLLPLPKSVVVTCCQCQDEERLCEKACPMSPPAIYFDKKTLHMVVDEDRCDGCGLCKEACGTEAVRFNPDMSRAPLVCDLCDPQNTGARNPQCVKICPTTAIFYHNRMERIRPLRDSSRKSSNEKAGMISKRLYPLTPESIAYPPWRPDSPGADSKKEAKKT